jgi:outer membrane biosynthesis protein TonB
MPDVTSQIRKASQLKNSPNVPTREQQPAAPTPPAPEEVDPRQPQPTPPQPKPTPQPKPVPKPPEPQPPKPLPPQLTKNQVDPVTGLPVLPPIEAPTIEPQSTRPKSSAPPLVLPSVAADLAGRAGMSGEPTPDSTSTELGRYKAKVYLAVGSRWYPKVDKQLSLLSVGMVKIQYTIHYDGTVQTKVLEGANLAMLLPISLNSITEAAPFDPFTDAMRKQVGDSYTDYFTFSVYGQ